MVHYGKQWVHCIGCKTLSLVSGIINMVWLSNSAPLGIKLLVKYPLEVLWKYKSETFRKKETFFPPWQTLGGRVDLQPKVCQKKVMSPNDKIWRVSIEWKINHPLSLNIDSAASGHFCLTQILSRLRVVRSRLDISHQLLLTPLWGRTLSIPIQPDAVHARPRCQSIPVNAPQKTSRLIQAYHAACLSACQTHHVSSHPGCLTNVSFLSVHHRRCHSICLVFWVCTDFYFLPQHQGANYPSGGVWRVVFPTWFVMLIRSVGVGLYDGEHVCVWQFVCVCADVPEFARRRLRRRRRVRRGAACFPSWRKNIITFQMCWMSPRWSMGYIMPSDRCGTCHSHTMGACGVVLMVYFSCFVTYVQNNTRVLRFSVNIHN